MKEVAEAALATIADRDVSTTVRRTAAATNAGGVRSALQGVQNVAGKAVQKIAGTRTTAAASAAATQRLCSVANALWFVQKALESWDDDMLYVELESMIGPLPDAAGTDDGSGGGGGDDGGNSLHGRVLGKEIGAYSDLLTGLLSALAKETSAVLTQRCIEDYVADLGATARVATRTDIPDLSAQLGLVCSSMAPLLQAARKVLSPEIAPRVWTKVARIADEALFDAVLRSSGFTEGMAAQLQHDMVFGLFLLFASEPPPSRSDGGGTGSEAGNASRAALSVKDVVQKKASSLMTRMTEACYLLTLDEGTWSRMNGLLSMESCATDQIAELRKLGILRMSRQDAAEVVKRRVDKLGTANPGM